MHLSCTTLADSYEKIMKEIIWNHAVVKTEDGEMTWQHGPMLIEITNPTSDDYIHKNSPYGAQFYQEYANAIVNGYKNSDFEYDYHSRLFEYYSHDGVKEESAWTNQIDYIIKKLTEEETTRRAIAITWDPLVDTTKKDVPCLQNLQFWILNDLLYMSVFFRSEDMLMAYSQNVYGITSLMKYVSEQVDVKIGRVYWIVTIPHCYNERDANWLQKWFQ